MNTGSQPSRYLLNYSSFALFLLFILSNTFPMQAIASENHQLTKADGTVLMSTGADMINKADFILLESSAQITRGNQLRKQVRILNKNNQNQELAAMLASQMEALEESGSKLRINGNELRSSGIQLAEQGFKIKWAQHINNKHTISTAPNKSATQAHNAKIRSSNPKLLNRMSESSTATESIPSISTIQGDDGQNRPDSIDLGTFKISRAKQFFGHIESQQSPIKLNSIHNWILTVTDQSGEPVAGKNIEVIGHMPGHVHGMPTAPKIRREIQPGQYLVEGMKFQMQGWWVIEFVFNDSPTDDRLLFNIEL